MRCYLCNAETAEWLPSGVSVCGPCRRREFGTTTYAALEEDDGFTRTFGSPTLMMARDTAAEQSYIDGWRSMCDELLERDKIAGAMIDTLNREFKGTTIKHGDDTHQRIADRAVAILRERLPPIEIPAIHVTRHGTRFNIVVDEDLQGDCIDTATVCGDAHGGGQVEHIRKTIAEHAVKFEPGAEGWLSADAKFPPPLRLPADATIRPGDLIAIEGDEVKILRPRSPAEIVDLASMYNRALQEAAEAMDLVPDEMSQHVTVSRDLNHPHRFNVAFPVPDYAALERRIDAITREQWAALLGTGDDEQTMIERLCADSKDES